MRICEKSSFADTPQAILLYLNKRFFLYDEIGKSSTKSFSGNANFTILHQIVLDLQCLQTDRQTDTQARITRSTLYLRQSV